MPIGIYLIGENMRFKLSICIPTYNRGKFLVELFESILCQIDKNNEELIEVTVSDNASTDNTEEIINIYKNKFKNFVYFKWDRNMGADRNYLKCVEIANGEFCWLMGSDDRIEKASIGYILDLLYKNNSVSGLSINRLAYDYNFEKILKERPVARGMLNCDTLLENVDDIVYYFGDYFGYISGQIVNKRLWDEVVMKNRERIREYLNAYVHVYVILNMIKKNRLWYYVHRSCVGWRSGNDSFLEGKYINRIKLDILGYEKIYGDVFGRYSLEYNMIMKKVCDTHVFSGVYNLKFSLKKEKGYYKLVRLCLKYYWRYPVFWYKTFIILIIPTFILKIVRFLYRKTLKKFIVR